MTLGAQGVGNRSYLYSRLIAEVLDLKVRWVLGYDTLQLYVAMEQGEVEGRVNDAAPMMTDKSEWFTQARGRCAARHDPAGEIAAGEASDI